MNYDEMSQEDKDLALHVAKMCEHMEWESTLPEIEKLRRRLPRQISKIGLAAKVAAENDMPWLLWGQMQIIYDNIARLLGDDWMEQARRNRAAWFDEDADVTGYGEDEIPD